MRIIEAYHCDFCGKYSKNKGVITKHEKECYHNPGTRACITCKHLNQIDHRRQYVSPDGVNSTSTSDRPVCGRGFELSPLDDNKVIGYRIDLKHHCEAWKEEYDDDDEYQQL